jgi:hypothetical protein
MSEMTPAEFIKTLKVDDKVEYVTQHGYSKRRLAVITVARFTSTQVICVTDFGREVRYRLDNGKQVGDHYEKFPLPVDAKTRAKVVDEMEAARLSGLLSGCKWEKLPLETLQRVVALVKEKSDAATDK